MLDMPKLLVVDDEAGICQVCRRILTRAGFRVDVSTDSREGFGWAAAGDYSGVLLDVNMPEMDGFEFLARLRRSRQDVAVMMMTAHPSIRNATMAVRLGASNYITKPFTPEQITRSVGDMLAAKTNGNGRVRKG